MVTLPQSRNPPPANAVNNLLTIDLEDWFHGIELPRSAWGNCQSRIERSTQTLLDILDTKNVKATFFVLGQVAATCPILVTRIAAAGHEIGTHGYEHRFVYQLSPSEFSADLGRSIRVLEDLTGRPVAGHRAPYFSINRNSFWAFEILAQHGIRYDSSIFPIRNYRYGIPDAPRHPHEIHTKNGDILELPVSTVQHFGTNLSFAGGFYLRFFPYWMLRRAIRSLHREGLPAILYLHPWELDPEHPRMNLPARIKLTHYHNLRSTESKLNSLLDEFDFQPVSAMLSNQRN